MRHTRGLLRRAVSMVVQLETYGLEFLASFLSADDTAGDTDSGSSASPAQEQTRLEQRTSAKLPGVSQSSKRPARWSMLRASSISGACAVRTKEMSRILSIPAAVLTDERS